MMGIDYDKTFDAQLTTDWTQDEQSDCQQARFMFKTGSRGSYFTTFREGNNHMQKGPTKWGPLQVPPPSPWGKRRVAHGVQSGIKTFVCNRIEKKRWTCKRVLPSGGAASPTSFPKG